jgi:molybdopterin converting factor small subunit
MSTVRIPPTLRIETNGQRDLELPGETLRELLDALIAAYPTLGPRLLEHDRVQPFLNIFVDGTDVRALAGLHTPIQPDSVVLLLPAMAGG